MPLKRLFLEERRLHSPGTHWVIGPATLHCDQFVALFVHQQFAVDAFVALSSETPDAVGTDGTVGSLLAGADNEKWEKSTHYNAKDDNRDSKVFLQHQNDPWGA